MNAKMAIGRAGRMTVIAGLTALAGCFPSAIDADFSGSDPSDSSARRGGGQTDIRDGTSNIQDGTSNTIAIGETPPSSREISVPRNADATDATAGEQPIQFEPPSDQAAATDAIDPQAPVSGSAVERAALLAALEDRFLTFGDSSFFSGGSITDSNELQLCAFGRFAMRVTRVTSTGLDTFAGESLLVGSWSLEFAGDAAFILLNVENATSADDLGARRLPVAIEPSSERVFIDGAPADSFDVSADCAAAAG